MYGRAERIAMNFGIGQRTPQLLAPFNYFWSQFYVIPYLRYTPNK